MRLTLTPELVKSIKQAIKDDRDDKWAYAQNMDVIESTMEEISAARDAFRKVDAMWVEVQSLEAGPASLDGGVLTWNKKDNRPEGWRQGWAYRARSRTGGPDHQITGNMQGEWSCNCKGARFGEKCWALKAVAGPDLRSFPSLTRPDIYGILRVWDADDDFGLIEDVS